MEQSSRNSTVSDPFEIQFSSMRRSEKAAWRLPDRPVPYHPSADVSLFSTSLPVLPHENVSIAIYDEFMNFIYLTNGVIEPFLVFAVNFNESDHSGKSLDDSFPSVNKVLLEYELKDEIEDFEPSTVLPDEEELFAGIMDDLDLSRLPTQVENLDDDFFGSGGSLEIESEIQENLVNGVSRLSMSDDISGSSVSQYSFANSVGTVSGEHPYGEHPSRTLFVRNINSNVEDSELRSLFEQYGDIRTLYTACKHRGFVMISYYDIRDARNAMRGLQNKSLRRRRLDIHFSIPKDNPSEKDINQGTLVVFNLDASVSNEDLRRIFGSYGEVKEIRETPHKRHHKFIEFYDVRAAEAALKALNRSDIAGKRIKLEPSRPGGAHRSLIQQPSQDPDQDEPRGFHHQIGSPIGNSPPGSWPNYGSPVEHNSLHFYSQSPNFGSLSPVGSHHSTGLASILPSHASNPVKIAPIGKDPGRTSQSSSYQNKYSLPDPKLSLSPGPISTLRDNSKQSSVGTLSGPQFLWGSPTIHSERPATSSSLNRRPFNENRVGFPYTSQHGSLLGTNFHVGSAPSGIQMEEHFDFLPESPETSYMRRAAFGVTNFGRNNGNRVGGMNLGVAFAENFSESGSPSSRMMSMARNGPLYIGGGSFGGIGGIGSDGFIERGRGRRGESGSQMDKNQYQLDLEKILKGEDSRTTLMIKNIPNKYTSNMLLAAIDETHKGTYDFLYLPIDFKNKCNVGYAFINMMSSSHIVTFYEAFNGKKWEKFNSEKVAYLAYARIQGTAALISHFQNSSLMNEDKCCRPIIFQSEGQGTGDLESLQSGNLNIFFRQPDGSYVGDSLDDDLDDKI